MKIVKYLLPVLLVIFMAGCIQIDEQVDVSSSGSGQYQVNMDMGQLLEMMQNYMGKDEMKKQIPKDVMDTTVFLKSIVDTAKDIPADKKELVRDGQVHMKLNMEEKVFKAEMKFPFKSLTNLQKLYTSFNDGSLNTGKLFKGLSGGNDSNAMQAGPSPDLNQFNAIYDFVVKDGMMSRKLNAEKWKALQGSSQFEQMKNASGMGVEIPYSLTINLPRPVKKVDNALAKLSDDKKSVVIKYNLTEVFEHPEKFEYTIAY